MVIAIYLVILVAAFYFLIVRPQRRQQMIRRQLIATVDVGDEIITSGGVYATVVALDDETLDIEVAPGIVVKLARGAVGHKITAPADAEPGDDEEEDHDDGHDDVDGGAEGGADEDDADRA